MKRILMISALVLAGVQPLAAQSPEEMVRWIYLSLAGPGPAEQKGISFMSAPDQRRQYFTQRMVTLFDADDTYGDDLASVCIGFGLSIPGQDYDEAEIARTLQLTRSASADRITVQADFFTFGLPATVSYDFSPEDGFWKIDDIVMDGHRLSDIPCTPKPATAPTPANAYCFQKGDAEALRLDLDGAGGARLEFWSWQANGHTCSGRPQGREVAGSWHFPGEGACALQLRVLTDGGVELLDPEWACKQTMCGQRAVIDQMRFPHSSRVDCAAWQGMGN